MAIDTAEYKQFVKKGFDEASLGYDKPAMRFFDKSAAHLVSLLHLAGNERVLDIATGTGKIALELAKRLPQGSVTGLDLSDGMLECAKQKLAAYENVSFCCEDVNEVEFLKDTFEGFCCGFGVFFWNDMQAMLERLLLALKPGGFFAMTSFADGSFMPQSELCLKRFERYGLELPKTYSWQKLDHPSKHHDLLNSVGLRQIQTQTQPMSYYLKDANEWWDLVQYTGFRSFLNQLTPQQVEKYKHEHLKEISGTADSKGIYLNVDVIFTTARKSID